VVVVAGIEFVVVVAGIEIVVVVAGIEIVVVVVDVPGWAPSTVWARIEIRTEDSLAASFGCGIFLNLVDFIDYLL
jgi:hypothetical protein